MKKKTVVTVFVSVLLLSSILGTRLTMPVNAPALHHVYSGESIQGAINSAQLGDVIFVHEGTYSQQVFVNKSLTLIGEDANTTIIKGVRAHKASYVKISGFTIRRSIHGINLTNCNSITISGNIVTDNIGYGIFLLNSRNIIISDNMILDNGDRGVYLRYSSYNTISNNTVSIHKQYGIHLFSSHNNVISCNTVSNMRAGAYGIYLASSSNNNFFGNTITKNNHGIVSHACNNNIYHNNFINNTLQVYAILSSIVWDDDHKGNYWSNYEDRYPDAEENPDNLGVWNTPYVIDENNVDRYPLMNPITIDYPIPTLVSVNYTDSIEVGEWITITIVARNDGGTAEWQTIHVGFPDNPPLENIEIVSHNLSKAEPYPPGTVLPANYGEINITSTYVMVEGVHEPWDYGEEHSMTVRVKPENIGTFTFYVKTVSRVEGVCARPTDTKDQQDEYVYVYEINVQPSARSRDLVEEYFPYLIFDEEEQFYPTDFFYDDTDITNNPSNYNESWPYYVYVHTVETEDYLCIQYWFYYCRDDELWGTQYQLFGAYDHDWESVYVYLEKQDDDYIPAFITYFKHDKLDLALVEYYATYVWDDPKAMKLVDTHPIVHVARDSHASYEKTTYGYGIFVTPFPQHPIIVAIKPCDDGIELDYDDFQIIYVGEPNSWPDQFGTVNAPWVRKRWNWSDPVFPIPVVEFSMLSLHETGSELYLHVYDNESRHVGFNEETFEVETEIPGSYYEDLGNTTFIIIPENITDFTFMVDATHADEPVEEYEITLITVRENEVVDEESMSGTIEKGEQQKFEVQLNPDGTIKSIARARKLPLGPGIPLWIFVCIVVIVPIIAVVAVARKRKRMKQQ